MVNPAGTPIWYELMTGDPDAAARFYGQVMGWNVAPPPPGSTADYRMLTFGDGNVGGMMPAPDGAPPAWLIYFGVDDVDAAVSRAAGLGATTMVPPTDIPNVGRFAMLADPQGAPFYVMRGASDADSTVFDPQGEGHATWNELVTTDRQAGIDFYARLFGITHAGGMPMGDDEYSFLTVGEVPLGAAMTLRTGRPRWFVYFRVARIDEAMERVRGAGGTLGNGPNQVPGGDWVIEATDPQGVTFGLVGKREEKST
jgi:uncharacterized protein